MVDKTILHYDIKEKIGEGGMGVVYKALDTKLKREVAIKFLPHYISTNLEERKRFETEAQAAAALNHPNIAHIYAIEETDDEMFIVMELINGKELREIIAVNPIEENELINIANQIAEGLKVAHNRGIVHRDIKSSNIMIREDGKIKIMDFGLAKIGLDDKASSVDSTSGTIAYMSPEQVTGDPVDQRSDIWSFGVVLYELLTGEMPFQGNYNQAIVYSIMNEKPNSLESYQINKKIQTIIEKTLSKDRDKRYAKIDEIIEDLKLINASPKLTDIEISEIKKLAVLPFSNIMNDPETNFLGFALADQIIGSMAYSKRVLIRPSSSIRKYQNDFIDVKSAAEELNVDFILAGNYLKQGETIRLNVELIDILSDKMVWREAIEIKYENVFSLQDIVAKKVVEGLKIQFSEEELERMKPGTPKNLEAYELYLQAIALPYSIEGNNNAIEILEKVIKLDPLLASAHMELGSRYHLISQVGTSTVVAQNKSEEAMLKALSLNKDLLPALGNLGLIYTDNGRHEEAHEMLIRALKINPNDAWLHFSLSYHYRYIGFLEESLQEAKIALKIDPNNPRFRSSIITRMFLGNYDEILETFNLDLDSPFTLNHLGEIAFRAGKNELALEYLEKVMNMKEEISELYFASSLIELIKGNFEKSAEYTLKRELENPADSENFYEIARVYGISNKVDACARALKKSIDRGYLSYPSMQNDMFLDPVRESPEIKELLQKVKGLHEELRSKLSTNY
jgi:serine/threonine protein kinase